MTTSVQTIEQKARPILEKYGVVKAALFGSVARGTGTKDSDIDFLVDFPAGKTLLDLVALRRELAEELGRTVDVVTYRSLHPFIKTRVLKDQRPIL